MRIIGIDPGLKATGYGVIECRPGMVSLLETGTIEPKTRQLIQDKLDKVYKNLNDLVTQYRPEVMVLEKLYSHYKHPTTACIMGHVRGVICLVCAKSGIELIEYSVKRIRKALTGNGNSSKLQVRGVVANILNVNEQKLTLDASDALALALAHAQMSRRGIYDR